MFGLSVVFQQGRIIMDNFACCLLPACTHSIKD